MARSHSYVILAVIAATCILNVAVAQSEAQTEVSSLDFDNIIGGPLTAVVRAQGMAAQTTLEFITGVGFQETEEGGLTTRMVEFGYSGVDDTGAPREGKIVVPLLTIVPIPYLRFASSDLEFNVKINSQSRTTSSSETNVNVNADVTGAFGPVVASVSASVSHQSQSSSESSIQREYSMRVFVHVVQAELPEGMAKILDKLLEISYTSLTGNAASSSGSGGRL